MYKNYASDEEIQAQVLAFMIGLGIEPAEDIRLNIDGAIHTYKTKEDKQGQKSGRYLLHNDGWPAGYVQDWRKGIKENWKFNIDDFPEERKDFFNSDEFRRAAEKRKSEREKALKAKQIEASERARVTYEQLQSEPEGHPYLNKKDINPYDLRINTASNTLAVPLKDIKGQIISLQWIDSKGGKRFFSEATIEGAFWSVALDTLDKDDKLPILLGEGVATMAKIYELTQLPVVAAMNCGALMSIAKILKGKYPSKKIIVMADDDKETELKRGFNPGIRDAQAVCNAKLAVAFFAPPFKHPKEGTDWDDYALKYGNEQTAAELQQRIKWACLPEKDKVELKAREALIKLVKTLDPSVQLPPQEFIGGMFPRNFVSGLVAPSGTGKTMFVQKFVSDLTIGGSVFDGFAEDEPPRTCMIFAGEAGYELLVRRGAQTKWAINPDRAKVIDQYTFENNSLSVMLDNPEGWLNITRLIDIYHPDIVFFDTFTSFHERDENKATEIKPLVKGLADLAREYNNAVVLVHHSRKRTAKERTLSLNQDDVIGSSVFNRLVGLIVGIEPMKEDDKTLLVRPLKTWFSAFMPFTYRISEDSAGHTVVQTDLAPENINNSKIAVWNYLRKTFTPGEWFSLSQVVLTDIVGTPAIWQVRRILADFAKNKKINKRGTTKSVEYSLIGIYDKSD